MVTILAFCTFAGEFLWEKDTKKKTSNCSIQGYSYTHTHTTMVTQRHPLHNITVAHHCSKEKKRPHGCFSLATLGYTPGPIPSQAGRSQHNIWPALRVTTAPPSSAVTAQTQAHTHITLRTNYRGLSLPSLHCGGVVVIALIPLMEDRISETGHPICFSRKPRMDTIPVLLQRYSTD